ncbi:MAG: acyl-CoA thioesterase, partial [Dehalococcoidia bacterium]
TVHLEADFRRPFQFGDRVDVEVVVEHLGNKSLRWRYRIYQQNQDEISVEGRVVTACVDLDTFTTMPVPDWLRNEIRQLQGGQPS